SSQCRAAGSSSEPPHRERTRAALATGAARVVFVVVDARGAPLPGPAAALDLRAPQTSMIAKRLTSDQDMRPYSVRGVWCTVKAEGGLTHRINRPLLERTALVAL